MSRSSYLVLVAARSAVEAVALALGASLAAAAAGRLATPFEIWVDTFAALLFWSSAGPLVRSRRARTALAGGTVVVAAALAVGGVGGPSLAAWPAALAGALFGTLVVARGLGIAGSVASWRAAALAGLAATLALVAGAVALEAKRDLAVLAVLGGAAAVAALSAARGVEETFSTPHGAARGRPGTVSAALVGVGALLAAAAFPYAGTLLAAIGTHAEPLLRALVVILVTPFVYLADALVRAILPLLRDVRIDLPPFGLPGFDPAAEEEYARQLSLEAQVFFERLLITIVLLLIAALVARAVLARVLLTRATDALERESIAGARLSDLLRGLFVRGGTSRAARPSGDDAHARIRRAYWDLLALAERAGGAWRAPAQTPREHLAALSGGAWEAGAGVVAPFERSRYGERATVDDAEQAERAVREVERGLQARA